jgi:Beta-galactosidase, domain 3/Beta-galactosidase, domain 2
MTHAYLTLDSRESRIILVDFQFGTSSVLHTSATVLFAGVIDGRDVLFLHGDPSQAYEMELLLKGKPNGVREQSGKVTTTEALGGRTLVTFLRGTTGLVTVWDSDQQLVLYSDSKTAETFYAPTISLGDGPFRNYWQFGTNITILIGGPHLVRSAHLNQEQLELRGDLKESTRLTIIGISGIRRITWNGWPITDDLYTLASGVFSVPLEMRRDLVGFEPPTLGPWKYHDSLPEREREYDDGDWIGATRTSTLAPKPLYGDGTVLYGCDYGL